MTRVSQDPAQPRPQLAWRLAALFGVLAVATFVYVIWGDRLTLDRLVEQEAAWRAFRDAHPLWSYLLAFALYVVVTGFSLPGAAALSMVYGWFFGFLPAVVLVSFASTSGATIAFLLSRYLLRDLVASRFGGRWQAIDEAFRREGAYYLFMLRLVPAVPFFAINLVMGLTPIHTWTFAWVSQLGMLPGTCVYVYAGSAAPTLAQLSEQGVAGIVRPQLLLALAALGVLPWLLKRVVARWRRAKQTPT